MNKALRDSKESTPAVTTPIMNDSKPSPAQLQQSTDRKSLHRDNSHELNDKDVENDRKVPVVSLMNSYTSC